MIGCFPCVAAACEPRPALLAWLLWASLLASGCASAPPAPSIPYEQLVANALHAEEMDPAAIRRAFLAAPDFADRLRQLMQMEQQVLTAMDEDPLRLGAIGSAVLDQYYASLAGHRALTKFYRHLEATEQADWHDAWVQAICADIESSGSGETTADPYRALSANEAQAFLDTQDATAVGAQYVETESHPLLLQVATRRGDGPVQRTYFDLHDLYAGFKAAVASNATAVFPVGPPYNCETWPGQCEPFSSGLFLRILGEGDSAAQTTMGWSLATEHSDLLNQGGRLLGQAAGAGNALASLLLVDVFLTKSYLSDGEERRRAMDFAERHAMLAVAAGFDSAMFKLGRLYLLGAFGEGKMSLALPLLTRSADFDNVNAQLFLGQLHASGYGPFVERDLDIAEQYYRRAASHDADAKVYYARFLMSGERQFNEQAWQWVRQAAENRKPDAMLVVGDLYAKGVHVDKNLRRARSWYKNAVRAVPDDPHFVNEVAWRLTASNLLKLRDERYALKIMDRVMADENQEARRNPAYLDTWAAAHAANGNFEQAISVQEEAIHQAVSNDDPNSELDILREHLDAFRAGEPISDNIP